MRRDAVQAGGHPVLAHAPVERPAGSCRSEGAALRERRAGAAAEVGRAADQIGDGGGDRLERQAGGLARRERRRWPARCVGSARSHPSGSCAATATARTPRRASGCIRGVARRAARATRPRARRPAPAASRQWLSASSGTKNVGSSGHPMISLVRRTSSAPSGAPWASAVSRLVGAGSAMWVRSTIRVGPRRLGAAASSAAAMAARSLPSPTRTTCQPYASKRRCTSSREGERGVAVDGDVVVVVDQGELAEPEVPGERGRLARDAFHQVAVAHEGPGAMIDDPVARPVEVLRQEPLGDRHPDRVADALAQRAGGGLDAGRVAPLGMARRLASPTGGMP